MKGDFNEIKDIDKKIANALHELNKYNYEKEIRCLHTTKKSKGMAAAMYKIKDKVQGVKEPPIDAMPIKDPETGILLTDPEEINEVTLNYCLDVLKDREPKPEFKQIHKNF